MSDWISIMEKLPTIGQWSLILIDRNLGDYWDRLNKPRFSVIAAQLRAVDEEGWGCWQQYQMSDGGPMGSHHNLVSHWMPYPEPPVEEELA